MLSFQQIGRAEDPRKQVGEFPTGKPHALESNEAIVTVVPIDETRWVFLYFPWMASHEPIYPSESRVAQSPTDWKF